MKIIVLVVLQSRDKTNHVFSLFIYLDKCVTHGRQICCMLAEGSVFLLGPFCLYFQHTNQKLGLFWAQRLEPRVRQFKVVMFCNAMVTMTLCHRSCSRGMVPFLLLLIVQIWLNLNICNAFHYK